MKSLAACLYVSILAIAGGTANADSDASKRIALHIEPQPVRAALKELSDQAGVQVLMRVDNISVDEVMAPGVNGELTLKAALDQLLSNTGLKYELVGEKTVRIAPVEGSVGMPAASATYGSDTRLAQADTSSSAEGTPQNSNMVDSGQQPAEDKLEEITVTAQKREERLNDVPISISVLQGKDLDKSSLVSVTDALKRVPGVSASEAAQGGGTRVAIRGVGSAFPLFAGSSPIGYYLDSVPFSLVKTSIGPDQSAYDLERVEVLRGPQGTLYGASAANGLVRVLTHDANLDEFEWKARATVSSTERGGENYRADTAVNVPLIPGKLAVRGVVGDSDVSGWIESPVGRDVNDAGLRNYRLKINAQPSDDFSIGLSGWRSENEYGAPSFSDTNDRMVSAQDQSISTDYDTYGLKLDYRFASFTISSMSGYLDYQSESNLGLNFTGTPGGTALFTGIDATVFSQEVLLNSAADSSWRWSLGAFYRDAKDRLRQNALVPGNQPVDFGNSSESHAVFGEIGRRFHNDHLEWTLGLRNFHDDVTVKENISLVAPGGPLLNTPASFSSTTPRAVLTWYPNDTVTVYSSYSEGFRSGFPQDPGVARTQPLFPAVKPDELKNYEIGAKTQLLDRRLSLDTALYFIDWKDVQQVLNVPFNGTFVSAPINGESASGIGVDFGLTARPVDGLELGASVSWNDLRIDADVDSVFTGPLGPTGPPEIVRLFDEGDRLNISPEYTIGAFVDYVVPLGGSGLNGRFSASGSYTSAMDSRIIAGLPGSRFRRISFGEDITTTNVSFSLESADRWTGTVFVDNANDEQDAIFGNAAIPSWSTRPRPRTVGVQFEVYF